MKKIAIIIIIFCFVGSINAQKIQMGIKFNPNLGWFKVDSKTKIENKGLGLGFSYGLIVDYHFLENVALCLEPSHLFFNPSTAIRDSNISVKWKIQYVQIPITLKMMTNQIGKFKYFGKIGMSGSVRTTARLEENKANKSVGLFDFAILVGGGIHYSLGGNTALLLGATFHNGLARLNKDESFTDQNIPGTRTLSLKDVKLKSSFINIDIGVVF